MSASEKLLIGGAAHILRTRLEVAQHGRAKVFRDTLINWIELPVGIILFMGAVDICSKTWAAYWHDFPQAFAFAFKVFVVFAGIGLIRAMMRASAG